MIAGSFFGTALVVAVATGPMLGSATDTTFSAQQKMAATEPLVRSATDCIVHAVTTDPRFSGEPGKVGDLIVNAMPSCRAPVRAMIDAYDLYYGEGTGEAFFMGPYLDVLPKAVLAGPKNAAQ
jgi:hypothetical protein